MTENQPQSPAEALQRAVRDLGRRLSENPDRVRAVLSDGLGATAREHRAAIDALALASEEGVPATLMDREDSALTETDLIDDDERLMARLTDRGLDDAAAAFAVGTWALALGTESTLTSTSTGTSSGAPLGMASGAAGPPLATELPAGFAPDTEDAPPPVRSSEQAGVDAASGSGSASAAGAGFGSGSANGSGGSHAGRDPGGLTTQRVVRVRRGLVAAAVAATLAVVGGTAWTTFRNPTSDSALLVGDVRRTTTTTAGSAAAEPTTTLPGTARSTATGVPPPSRTTAKKSVTKAPTKKATTAERSTTPIPPQPVRTTPRATTRSSTTPVPVRTTPKKRATSSSTSPRPRTSTSTKPKPPPPPPTLTAGNGTHSWTMAFWDGSSCLDWAGAGAVPCSRYINTVKGGTVSTWQVSDAVSVNGHGDVVVSGHRVQFFPHHNGYFQDVIRYRLSGGGVTSNWATLTITAYCDTYYTCFG